MKATVSFTVDDTFLERLNFLVDSYNEDTLSGIKYSRSDVIRQAINSAYVRECGVKGITPV